MRRCGQARTTTGLATDGIIEHAPDRSETVTIPRLSPIASLRLPCNRVTIPWRDGRNTAHARLFARPRELPASISPARPKRHLTGAGNAESENARIGSAYARP